MGKRRPIRPKQSTSDWRSTVAKKPINPTQKSTPKKRISPVKITMEVIATKVNENGTLSGFETIKAKASGTDIYAVSHNASGGSIWLKTTTLDGLNVLSDVGPSGTVREKVKLF